MDLYLVRHPPPELQGSRCYGRLDVGLAPGWHERATQLAARLPAAAHIIASPDRRCRELAEYLAAASGRAPLIDADLQELDFGAWEGLEWAAIPRHETIHWAKDLWNRAPPGGETYASLFKRVSAVWDRLLLLDEDCVLIVGNTGPLRALLTVALELPTASFARFHLDHGGLSLLSDASGGWRLEFSNR